MKKANILTALCAITLLALPGMAMAESKMSPAETRARASVGSELKWNKLTRDQKDVLIQRADADLKRHNMNPNERHYPDKWQGATQDQKDIMRQRRGANMITQNTNPNERHYPDRYQGLTAEEKQKIKMLNSTGTVEYSKERGLHQTGRNNVYYEYDSQQRAAEQRHEMERSGHRSTNRYDERYSSNR